MDHFAARSDEASRVSSAPWPGTVLLLGLSMLAAMLAIVVVLADAKPASAHFNGSPPSRASNGNIIVRCFSNNYCGTYDWSRGPWNNQPGTPSVVADTSTNPAASLWIAEDYYDSTVETVAYWSAGYDPDRIYNNNYWMKGAASTYKHVVSTHELGHSLGFAHASYMGEGDTYNYCRKAVMYPNTYSATQCDQVGYVMPHDQEDWVIAWGTT
jgi:hypothetical protein